MVLSSYLHRLQNHVIEVNEFVFFFLNNNEKSNEILSDEASQPVIKIQLNLNCGLEETDSSSFNRMNRFEGS